MNEDDDYDAQVGRNLRTLREARGMTQAELASAVTERGLPFRQQTIVKIEQGHRPLRLREAHEIASALDLDIADLVVEEFVLDMVALLASHTRSAYDAWGALHKSVGHFLDTLGRVQFALRRVGQEDGVSQSLLNEAATVIQADPVKIAKGAVDEYEAQSRVRQARYESGVTSVQYEKDEHGVD